MKNELLAPNEKPSNLTATQYNLVRTPAFKAWFGDWENDPANASKVVDENGEPMVAYHFSDINFNVFEIKGLSDGFFFTKNIEDEEFSQKGALKSQGLTYEQAKEKGYDLKYEKGKPYFLNIKQFFTKSNVKKSNWSTPYFENSVIEFAKRNKKNDGVEFLREIDNKQIIVAFESNQIKLADGTNTLFDITSDDIRFVKGGKVKGDCYLVAGQIAMEIRSKKIDYKGTPYLVHAEVKHSTLDKVRFGHAFIEDDENVYDFSNNREIIIPKQLYYYFGDINPKNKKKYRKYTFKEAREKMISTGNYGCWDIDVEFNNGGEIVKSYKREIPDYLKMFLDL